MAFVSATTRLPVRPFFETSTMTRRRITATPRAFRCIRRHDTRFTVAHLRRLRNSAWMLAAGVAPQRIFITPLLQLERPLQNEAPHYCGASCVSMRYRRPDTLPTLSHLGPTSQRQAVAAGAPGNRTRSREACQTFGRHHRSAPAHLHHAFAVIGKAATKKRGAALLQRHARFSAAAGPTHNRR